MKILNCCACGKDLHRRSQNPDQKYCNANACVNERNRLRKAERRKDPSYREAERTAQKKWRDENSRHMRDYRRKHPKYVEDNRNKQRVRNANGRLDAGASEKEQSQQAVAQPTGQKSSSTTDNDGTVIVKSNSSKGLAAKGYLEEILSECHTVIVKSNSSTPCVPMVLVPLPILTEIVKATRQKNSHGIALK